MNCSGVMPNHRLRADMPQASQTARRHDGHLKLLYSHHIRTISAISCETCSAMIRQTAAFAAYQHHIRHTVVCRITTYARVSLRCFVAVSLLLIRCFLAVLAAVFSAVPSMVCGGFARFFTKKSPDQQSVSTSARNFCCRSAVFSANRRWSVDVTVALAAGRIAAPHRLYTPCHECRGC